MKAAEYRMLCTACSSFFLTSMAKWKLCFVLLLPLTVCFGSRETFEKTIGGEPDVTPICTNKTHTIITLILCKISTERSREECHLMYRHGQDFEHECDSRFTLMTENQTVFLHLTSLTPEDGGNYTCECTHLNGTDVIHLNITVKEDEDASNSTEIPFPIVLIGVPIVIMVIIITGLILGCICRTKSNRDSSRSATSGLSVCEAPCSLDQDDPDDPYTSLQHPASDLYQSISDLTRNIGTHHRDGHEMDGSESESSFTMYENV